MHVSRRWFECEQCAETRCGADCGGDQARSRSQAREDDALYPAAQWHTPNELSLCTPHRVFRSTSCYAYSHIACRLDTAPVKRIDRCIASVASGPRSTAKSSTLRQPCKMSSTLCPVRRPVVPSNLPRPFHGRSVLVLHLCIVRREPRTLPWFEQSKGRSAAFPVSTSGALKHDADSLHRWAIECGSRANFRMNIAEQRLSKGLS